MSLWLVASLSAVGAVLGRWLLVPWATRRASVQQLRGSLRGHSLVALSSVAASVCACVAVGSVVALVMVYAPMVLGLGGPDAIHAAVAWVQDVREWLADARSWVGATAVTLLAVVLVVLHRRANEVRISAVAERVRDLEFERLRAAYRAGDTRDDRLARLATLLDGIDEAERALDARVGTGDREVSRDREELHTHRRHLRAQWDEAAEAAGLLVRIDPGAIAEPAPRTWRDRIVGLFVSRGLLSTLRTGSRATVVLCTVLLVPSSLSLAAPAVAGELARREVRLGELLVSASEAEALDSWVAAGGSLEPPAAGGSPAGWGRDDEEAADVLARAYEVYAGGALDAPVPWIADPAELRELRSAMARDRILSDLGARGRARHTDWVARTPSAPREGSLLATVQSFQATAGPRTELGRRYRAELPELARRAPSLWSNMRTRAQAAAESFRRPATAGEVTNLLRSEVLGQALGDRPAHSPLGEAATELGRRVDADAIERAHRTLTRRFSVTAAREGVVRAASEAPVVLAERPVFATASVQQLRAAMSLLPAGEHVARAAREARFGLEGAARPETPSTARWRGHGSATPILGTARPLLGRPSSIPRALRAMPGGTSLVRPARGWAIRPAVSAGRRASLAIARPARASPGLFGAGPSSNVWGLPGGGRGYLPTPPRYVRPLRIPTPRYQPPRARFVPRGRKGILLDGEVSGADPPDIVDVGWSVRGSAVRIWVVNREGARIDLGEHDQDLVKAAAAFAADEDPLAVTLSSAEPLFDAEIELHPSLVDTRTGCELLRTDVAIQRLLSTARLAEIRAGWQATSDLYRLAWTARALMVLGAAPSATQSEWIGKLRREALWAELALADHRHWPRSLDAGQFGDGLAVSDLVEQTNECLGSSTARDFRACVAIQVRPDVYLGTFWDSWQQLPPTPVLHAGLVERPFRVDRGLAFVRGAMASRPADQAWPFASEMTLVFAHDDGSPASIRPAIAPEFVPALDEHILRDPRFDRSTATLATFAGLVRLFRAGFRGQLGPDFPVERAADLHGALRSAEVRTPRWVPSSDGLRSHTVAAVRFAVDELGRGRLGDDVPGHEALAAAAGECAESLASTRRGAWPDACDPDRFEDVHFPRVDHATLAFLRDALTEARLAELIRAELRVEEESPLLARLRREGCAE